MFPSFKFEFDFGSTENLSKKASSSQSVNANLASYSKPSSVKIDLGNLAPRSTSPFSQMVVFGDSLSDRGNLFNLSRRTTPSAPYFRGRFSNGPIWVDFMAPSLGISRTTNFAIGGATTGRDNIGNSGTPGRPRLPGLLDQIDAYRTIQPQADPRALYVVWAGGNDFLQVANQPQNAATVIQQAVANLSTAITQLATAGAKNIAVPNQINFGLTPLARDRGISSLATVLTVGFNQALAGAIAQLKQSLNINLVGVDLFSLGQRVAASPAEFGFTNVRDRLIQQTNPVNPAGYFWWDDVHPTTQVQKLIAQTIQAAVTPRRELPALNDRSQPTLAASLASPLQQI
jgi:phospholipase/lecithinase/hemolysin